MARRSLQVFSFVFNFLFIPVDKKKTCVCECADVCVYVKSKIDTKE